MSKRQILLSALLLSACSHAYGQSPSFDMTGERPAGVEPLTPRLQVPPLTPSTPATPAAVPPASAPVAAEPARPASLAAPTGDAAAPVIILPPVPAGQTGGNSPAVPVQAGSQPQPQPQPQTQISADTPQALSQDGLKRFVVPSASLRLQGEYDRRSWSVYVTPEQATAPAVLDFAYRNAVVVAPEESQLTVSINNRVIGSVAISSPDAASAVSFAVPRGLLQPGGNLLTFETSQRHRTDCTVDSTYELWTEIDPAQTFFSFSGLNPAKLSSADAIRAIGVDAAGKTGFDFVVPALEQPAATKPLLRLAQGLSILSGMPDQTSSFSIGTLPGSGSGRMTVLVGTYAELQPLYPDLQASALSGPVTTFVSDKKTGLPMLLVGGPSWPAIASAIDSLVSPTDQASVSRREAVATERWNAPNAPLLQDANSVTFADLGLKTSESSGRRSKAEFSVAVPADFYANAYGEATILLDAAYSSEVLPGSRIDIYVNDNIASTAPIAGQGGGLFQHRPIRLTMRHFRPGLNKIRLEPVTLTQADAVCAPGTTASKTPRFALFDTSEFVMPDFARMGQRPNLAGFSGSAYPYSYSQEPTALFIDRVDEQTMSAAASLLARMALVAGHPLPIQPVAAATAVGSRNAIFIGAISQIPASVLSQVNVAPASQVSWRPAASAPISEADTAKTVDAWRTRVSDGFFDRQMQSLRDWLRRNFDITASSLQLFPGAEEAYMPSNATTLLIAQGGNPDGSGTWTAVTAPTAKDLRESVAAMSGQVQWAQISGRLTAYSSKTAKIETVAAHDLELVASQPLSLQNFRLVAANWLSTNVLYYAVLLVVFAMMLGLATTRMLARLGRRI